MARILLVQGLLHRVDHTESQKACKDSIAHTTSDPERMNRESRHSTKFPIRSNWWLFCKHNPHPWSARLSNWLFEPLLRIPNFTLAEILPPTIVNAKTRDIASTHILTTFKLRHHSGLLYSAVGVDLEIVHRY